MEEYQKRMLLEKEELNSKIEKLEKFINENELFKKLPNEEQFDMRMQLAAMKQYGYYLFSRIRRQNI